MTMILCQTIRDCDIELYDIKQEAQLMLTNPRDAFTVQSRSPNIRCASMVSC